jgi:hypothetical protein
MSTEFLSCTIFVKDSWVLFQLYYILLRAICNRLFRNCTLYVITEFNVIVSSNVEASTSVVTYLSNDIRNPCTKSFTFFRSLYLFICDLFNDYRITEERARLAQSRE